MTKSLNKRLGDVVILLPKQRRFDELCERMSSSFAAAGLTTEDLMATLPEARDRVYARRYGEKPAGQAFQGRGRGK
jgi:hypothetical protein